MRRTIVVIGVLASLATGCGERKSPAPGPSQAQLAAPEVRAFAAAKEAQARKLGKELNLNVAPEIWSYFASARKGDSTEVALLWEKLRKRAGQYEGSKNDARVTTEAWQTVLETCLAYEQVGSGDPEYARTFAHEVIDSIPPGSIYFGGTDPGRGLITLYSKSHERGEPFFTLTQNALADQMYLSYLRSMYGQKLYIPTGDDSQKAFQEYLVDAQERLQANKLKPGEDVKVVDNRVQVSGQTAVMQINGLLAKCIFERNTNCEFFVEESFPLDWMYPHLRPHGLIMKLERPALPAIAAEDIKKDHQFWSKYTARFLGDWLKPDTDIKEVCSFALKTFRNKNLADFRGDPKYLVNTNACQMFAKCRSAIGELYHWRAKQAAAPEEKQRLQEAADFAFKQAFALCPDNPETAFRYTALLLEEDQAESALRIAQAALLQNPDNEQFQQLERNIANKRRH